MFRNRLFIYLVLFFLLATAFPVSAKQTSSGPTYVVQSGDTLTSIAARFGISITELINANNMENPDALFVGTELTIPGLEGITGRLDTETVPLGETLQGMTMRYQIAKTMLNRLNRIVSPSEVYAGNNLIIPKREKFIPYLSRGVFSSNQTMLEMAAQKNMSTWDLKNDNFLARTWALLPGDMVYSPSQGEKDSDYTAFSPWISTIKIDPLPLIQGTTVTIRVTTKEETNLTGNMAGYGLHFYPEGNNTYVALQGVHAMAPVGLTSISISNPNQADIPFEQRLLLRSDYFAKDPPLFVDPETIDPAITKPEEQMLVSITGKNTDIKQWTGKFRVPVDTPCIKSWYGNRRSYNGSDFSYFHAGLDYGVCADNLNIYAPAAGTVVYTGELTVRGNATIIDHGWGVFTGYWHQESIGVKVGDKVEPGQIIGQIGKTGRVTGPHLHWEIWVNGVQVEPATWLEKSFP
jgi:murein DD-endopeptidase MepM/ murein hydrolase activator NlpD